MVFQSLDTPMFLNPFSIEHFKQPVSQPGKVLRLKVKKPKDETRCEIKIFNVLLFVIFWFLNFPSRLVFGDYKYNIKKNMDRLLSFCRDLQINKDSNFKAQFCGSCDSCGQRSIGNRSCGCGA